MSITRRAFLGMSAAVAAVVGLVVAGQLTGCSAGGDEPCPTTAKDAAAADAAAAEHDTSAIADGRVYVAVPAAPQVVPEDCWPDEPTGEGAPATPRTTPPSATTPEPPSAAEADTTGVADGVALVAAEPGSFDDDGLVLEGLHIVGDVTLTGNDQTLRNVRIEGHVIARGRNTVIEDSELGALSVSGATAFTARRVEVFGASGHDGVHITSGTSRTSDIVIEDSWVHSPKVEASSHYDGIQVRGVDRLTLRGNSIDLGAWSPRYTAAIMLESANGGNADVTVEGNYINGGGYSLYLGGQEITVSDNQFGRSSRWGLVYPEYSTFSANGNTWADTGEAVSLP